MGRKLYYNNGYTVKVADTVGAGDSFLAALITKLTNHTEPQFSLDFASAVGAIVASKRGANPKIEKSEIEYFLEKEYK
jgi:fructokinase